MVAKYSRTSLMTQTWNNWWVY